jgi:hypothetical protein
VSPEQVAYASLRGVCLVDQGSREELSRAPGELGIDPERVDPVRA